jgi:hypothetical protein
MLKVKLLASLLIGGLLGYETERFLLWFGVQLAPSVVPLTPSPTPPSHLHAFAVATRDNPWSQGDSASLMAAHGTNLRILGHGDTRGPSVKSGFKWAYALKLLHVRDAVSILPENDLVLVADAFDTYSVAPLVEFEKAFAEVSLRESSRQHEVLDQRPIQIIISSEAWCFPNESMVVDFPQSDRELPLPFPNSGVYIGRAGALHHLLSEGPYWDLASTDDQDWFARAYLSSLRNFSLPRVALDHDSSLAFSMGPHKSLRNSLTWDIEKNAWRDTLTSNHPKIFHYNGDKEDVKRGLVPRFWYGQVCFVEHWKSCSWWAAIPLLVSFVFGILPFVLPWQKILLPFAQCLKGAQKIPTIHYLFSLSQTLPSSLLTLPVITIFVMVSLCPLCARPQSTVWETLAYSLWPPTQLFYWNPEYASGRVLAAVIATVADLWLQSNVTRRFGAGLWARFFSFLALCISSLLGKELFRLSGGPPIDSSGCIAVSFATLIIYRLVVWMDQYEAIRGLEKVSI